MKPLRAHTPFPTALALAAVLALLLSACGQTPPPGETKDGSPPDLSSDYDYKIRYADADTVTYLTLGGSTFSGAVKFGTPNENGGFTGAVSSLGHNVRRLSVSASASSLFPNDGTSHVASIFDGMTVFMSSEDNVTGGAMTTFDLALDDHGSCLTGGEAFNAIGIPVSAYDQGSPDSAFGTVTTEANAGDVDLTMDSWSLLETSAPTPITDTVAGLQCTLLGPVMTNGVAGAVAMTRSGAGLLVLGSDTPGIGGFVLLPQSPGPIGPVAVAGLDYEGVLYVSDGTTLELWFVLAEATGTTGELALTRIDPVNGTASALLGTLRPGSPTEASPYGLFDAATFEDTGTSTGQARFATALDKEGKRLLTGLMQYDGDGVAPFNTAPTDWAFVLLREQ